MAIPAKTAHASEPPRAADQLGYNDGMLRGTRLQVFEWTGLQEFMAPADGITDPMTTVYDRPLDRLTLPPDADSNAGESFESLTAPDRFRNGDVVIVCQDENTVMGYVWLSFKDFWVSESRLFLAIADKEALVYDTFIFPQYRGRPIRAQRASMALGGRRREGRDYPVIFRLAIKIRSVGLARGCVRVITYAESHNTNSWKTQLHLGAKLTMSVYSIHFFDRFSLHWATGRPFASRFHR
jgi:hypothetical protein